MPTISMFLTLDALSNMVDVLTNFETVNPLVLSNVELCFDFIELGSEVDAMVRGMGDKIYIKSQSFSNSTASILLTLYPKISSNKCSYPPPFSFKLIDFSLKLRS